VHNFLLFFCYVENIFRIFLTLLEDLKRDNIADHVVGRLRCIENACGPVGVCTDYGVIFLFHYEDITAYFSVILRYHFSFLFIRNLDYNIATTFLFYCIFNMLYSEIEYFSPNFYV